MSQVVAGKLIRLQCEPKRHRFWWQIEMCLSYTQCTRTKLHSVCQALDLETVCLPLAGCCQEFIYPPQEGKEWHCPFSLDISVSFFSSTMPQIVLFSWALKHLILKQRCLICLWALGSGRSNLSDVSFQVLSLHFKEHCSSGSEYISISAVHW